MLFDLERIINFIIHYHGLFLCESSDHQIPTYYVLIPCQRLVRFLAKDGRTYYGDAILTKGVTDIAKAKQARVIQGQIFGKYEVTDQVMDIRLLLAPLALEDVKTVRCLGLNYEKHAIESNLPIPKYPVLFVCLLISMPL